MAGELKLNNSIVVGSFSSDPASGVNGEIYYNTTSNVLRQYINGTWANISSGSTSLTFTDSLVNTSGTVTLVNDSASPGVSKYYGTNSGSTLGYYSLPSGGSSSTNVSGLNGASAAIEEIERKAEYEHYGQQTEILDNSVNSGFNSPPVSYGTIGYMMDTFTSGGTTTPPIVWNPVFLNPSDQDTSSTTNWTTEGDGGSLTTSTTTKVGTHSLQYNKTSGVDKAGLEYSASAAILAIPNNTRLWFWIFLPTITGGSYTNVYVEIDIDGTNNSTWLLTGNYLGSSLVANAWNLMFVDLANTAASSSSGTGWTSSQSFRFFHIGLNTSVTTITLTDILINGIYFSQAGLNSTNPSPVQLVQLGSEVTLFDGTNRDVMVISSSNTQVDGPLSIVSSLSHTYSTPGVSSSTAANIERSSFIIGSNVASWATNYYVNTSNALAGNITKTQEVRLGTAFRDPLSSNTLGAYCCVNTSQFYTVSSTTTNVIVVNDASNQSANLLSGDTCLVFRTIYVDGQSYTVCRGSFILTSNSSASAGLTTLTGTGGVPSGTAIGDYVVKDSLTFSTSAVSVGANESFSSLTNNSSPSNPDGIILYNNGFPIPVSQNVYGVWNLNGNGNKVSGYGVGQNLTQTGSLSFNTSFKNDQLAASGFNTSNYLVASGSGSTVSAPSILSVSAWIYPTTTSTGYMLNTRSTSSTGWILSYVGNGVATFLPGGAGGGASGGVLNLNAWNHIVVTNSTSGNNVLFVNGTQVSSVSATNLSLGGDLNFGFGSLGSLSMASVADRMAQVIIWTGVALNQTQVQQLYNNGLAQILGFGPLLKYRYQINSVSGQTISLKASLTRETTAVAPFITKMGAIKIG